MNYWTLHRFFMIYICHGIILRDKPDDHELKLFVFERDGTASLY